MSISPLSSVDSTLSASRAFDAATTAAARPTPGQVKKAAQQFEAIIMRQLLKPSIDPLLNNSIAGGGGEGGSGAGTYSYLLTDTLATSMAQGGGLGLARVLERQMTPPGADNTTLSSSAQQ